MTFTRWRGLFPLAVTLHNWEEAWRFPAWSQATVGWPRPVTPAEFWFAIAGLTLAARVITGLSQRMGPQSWATYLLVSDGAAMGFNLFIPHVLVTVRSQQYMPGLATALLVNLPVMSGLIYTAIREMGLDGRRLLLVSGGVTGALLAVLPLLFAIGQQGARLL